ncbi:GNAT family N-acetyltransferase [Acidiphilium sp. AL]|uniref:GNAT family N-acetyltransferase n=1 Tax=Acidiphilium iwatense TaxID=768198 RepID=A0ABS9DU58_9PROT|nr:MULTISPECIES: GNAT family N-acetyltransferase [Acidiphilium]MCF3946262.1 GNAT family N-acetyltransferase [Acidiphilium iwatense]MCU4158834.1 GNAT family N-acetyltransferase [Acidiphilium sp. AL]
MSAFEFRHADTDSDIVACFVVMRQLRPHLASEAKFLTRVRRQQGEGYRLLAAWQDGCVAGAAGYRLQENLIRGRFVYVDDLVVVESRRSGGLGALLLDEVARLAKNAGCSWMTLDTDLGNARAQRFYFRWGMLSAALHFRKELA